MNDHVGAIGAIGEVVGSRAVEQQPYPLTRSRAPAPQAGRSSGLREGAPADVVELSIPPDTAQKLPPNLYLKFMVDPSDGRVVIQVIDTATDKVVRVVPPKKLHETLQQLT
jgi:FlaG protein